MVDLDFLRKIALFKELEARYLRLIQGLLKEIEYDSGRVVVEEGIIGESLFVILSGKVRVSLAFGEERIVLTELGSYDYFGEMSLIDDHAAVARVETTTKTTLLALSRSDFKALLSSSTELSARMWESIARNLSSKIRKTDELVKAYYGLNKALCEDPQFREMFASWNFSRGDAETSK